MEVKRGIWTKLGEVCIVTRRYGRDEDWVIPYPLSKYARTEPIHQEVRKW